jgi:VanZ family protein
MNYWMLKRILNFWLVNAFWIAISFTIFILMMSLINSNSIQIQSFQISDKILHASAYMLMMWAWMMLLKKLGMSRSVLILLIALTMFGIVVEGLQAYLTESRTADWKDAVANFIGLIIGVTTFNQLFFRLIYQDKS